MRGFTLVEILIVIAILTILFAMGLIFSMDLFHGYSRRSERDVLVSVLERARSEAMANVHQSAWGVCFDSSVPASPQYVLFSGANYSSAITKQNVPANSGITIGLSGAANFPCTAGGIVFAQLTGDTVAQTITMQQGSIVSTISTNAVGRINW